MLLKDQEQNIKYRWLFGFMPAAFLLIFTLLTLSFFVSNYYVMSPRLTMSEWSCSGKGGNESAWNQTLAELESARKYDPWNADIYMDMGRLYEWKALSGSAWNSDTKEARTQASYYFKHAAVHRPTWALAWASFAQSQLINRVVDDEVFYALSNGFEYGRWQLETQKKLLWLSIGIWDKLPRGLQSQVREQVGYILEQDNGIQMLTSFAIRFQWFDELMPLIKKQKDRDFVESVRSQPKKMRDMLKGGQKPQDFVCRVAQ